jgi:deoxycytidine triphosphate deaminase
MSVLSDKKIMEMREEGRIVIEPFKRANLATSSYDVSLGRFYFREKEPEPGRSVYNPVNRMNLLFDYVVVAKQILTAHTTSIATLD